MPRGDMTFELDNVSYQKFMNIMGSMDKVEQSTVIKHTLKTAVDTIIRTGKSNLETRNKSKTGNLKRSFTRSVSAKKAVAYAGFRRSSPGKRIQGANHSYLVDRGTAKRYTKKGAYRGSVSRGLPNHGTMFWTDAVQSQGPAAMNRLMDAIYASLDKITKQR
jgi:hypothetical protein